MSDQNHGGEHTEHIVPISTYVLVFLALMIGTVITTYVATINLGPWNTPVALVIAFIKMTLVVLFFMHVKYATGLTRIVIIAGFFWLAIMITLTSADEFTRHWEMLPHGWTAASQTIVPFFSHLF